MISCTFVLKDGSSKTATPILLYVRYNYERIRYYTGEKILPDLWNKYYNSFEDNKNLDTKDISDKKLKEELKNINTQLGRYTDKIETLGNYFKNQKTEPSLDYIKIELDKEFLKNPKPLIKIETFVQFIDGFIKSTNKRASTIKGYSNTLNHIKEFELLKKKTFKFESVDLDFYDDFLKFLKKKNFTDNTIGKQIKNIKVFLSNAEDKGLHSNPFYKNRRFKVLIEETDSIYLSKNELEKIYNLDLSENKKLDRVRDLFIIGCWTGLRFSDLQELSASNIINTEEGNIIKIKTVKTGETVVIPLHRHINEILTKYNNNLPKVPSNQKMNTYLKEIGELAKINEPVELVLTKGGLRFKKTFVKSALIKTHTSRRSFATNMYIDDIPSISIMKITGHKTEKAFLQYIKISPEDNAKKMLKHPLFSQTMLKVI